MKVLCLQENSCTNSRMLCIPLVWIRLNKFAYLMSLAVPLIFLFSYKCVPKNRWSYYFCLPPPAGWWWNSLLQIIQTELLINMMNVWDFGSYWFGCLLPYFTSYFGNKIQFHGDTFFLFLNKSMSTYWFHFYVAMKTVLWFTRDGFFFIRYVEGKFLWLDWCMSH